MTTIRAYNEKVKLRDYSSAFSRNAFMDILNFDDYSKFNWLSSHYNMKSNCTYIDFLSYLYAQICKKYNCEYVYKNELIKLLLKKYGTKNTVYFSEFRIGNSIADITMFNGESKAFEIKTEYDSPKRLGKQLEDYKLLFDKVYLVVPENKLADYIDSIETTTGVIVLSKNKGRVILKEVKHAEQNPIFDSEVLISCLRTSEYKNIVSALGVELKSIPGYELFTFCKSVFSTAAPNDLKRLFLQEVKKRNNITARIRKYPMPIRQMMLSLNLTESKAEMLINKLNINVNSN